MPPRTKLPQGSVAVTFRLPRQTKQRWAKTARRQNLSLAEFIRRTLRREMEAGRGRR